MAAVTTTEKLKAQVPDLAFSKLSPVEKQATNAALMLNGGSEKISMEKGQRKEGKKKFNPDTFWERIVMPAIIACSSYGKSDYDTIDFISKQPWCSGSVTMSGNSYLAKAQLHVVFGSRL